MSQNFVLYHIWCHNSTNNYNYNVIYGWVSDSLYYWIDFGFPLNTCLAFSYHIYCHLNVPSLYHFYQFFKVTIEINDQKRSLWMAPLTHWGIGDLVCCSLIRVECRLLRLTLKEAWSGQAWRRHIFRLLRTELPTLVLHSLVVHALPDTLLDSVLC